MFVLPDHSLLSKSPLTSIPKFSDITDSSHLIALYNEDFIPFCNQYLPIIEKKLAEYKINAGYSIDSGEFSIRSGVREHDQLILEKLFENFVTAKNEGNLAPDGRLRVLEIDAGYSYSREAESASAAWLARWLATRFSELEVVISGTTRLFDRSLEKGVFNLADAIYLDCSDFDRVAITNCNFIFARQFYSTIQQETVSQRESPLNNDFIKASFSKEWLKADSATFEFERHSVLETIDREDQERSILKGSKYFVKQNIMPIRNFEMTELQSGLSTEEIFLFLNRSLGFGGSAVINISPNSDPLIVKFEELPTILNRSNILISGIK